MRFAYRSPRFFARGGLYLKLGRHWFRVIPLPHF